MQASEQRQSLAKKCPYCSHSSWCVVLQFFIAGTGLGPGSRGGQIRASENSSAGTIRLSLHRVLDSPDFSSLSKYLFDGT